MAILRDAQTGQGIATGTPAEMVALADELGRDNILFDDVGELFDPDAVLEAVRKERVGLEEVASNPGIKDAKESERVKRDASARVAELDAVLNPQQERVDEASSAIEEAHRQAENPV